MEQYTHTRLLVWGKYTLLGSPGWRSSVGAGPPLPLDMTGVPDRCYMLVCVFLFLRVHTDRYTRTLLQLKMTKWNIAAIFLWRRGAYKFASPKVSLTSAIHQTPQLHQSKSIRNYSPSKLHWKALICYWSLLLFSSILKDWKQKSNNVTVIVKCNFYWDWWEPICHNICF